VEKHRKSQRLFPAGALCCCLLSYIKLSTEHGVSRIQSASGDSNHTVRKTDCSRGV